MLKDENDCGLVIGKIVWTADAIRYNFLHAYN